MLVDVKNRIDEDSIAELLEYAVYSDGKSLVHVVNVYKTDEKLELLAYMEEDEIIGLVGFRIQGGAADIWHIAVKPEHRGLGYGRGVLLELISAKSPEMLVAETDEDAVDFYRNVGFTVSSLGEKYPGVERFQCIYHVHDEEIG